MKKMLHKATPLLLLGLFLLPVGVLAMLIEEPIDPEEGVKVILDEGIPAPRQCELDITADLPEDVNWNHVYMFRAPDGSVWQRSIMVRPKDNIVTLREGEALIFEGTGQPFSKNQIFIFNNNEDENGHVPIPDQATCWEVETSGDNEGRFEFAISANHYWDALGQEMIIDTFTQLEDSWAQYVDEETNQNFHIGTHMLPKVVTLVGEPDATEGCNYLCDENPAEESAAHDILLKSVILDPNSLEGEEYLLGNNFDILPGERIAISRYQHNFYGGTENDIEGEKDTTTDLAMKSMSMEVLKQMLLGKLDESVREPVASPIKSLTATSLKNAAGGTAAYSQEIQDIAGYIKAAMDNPAESVERTAAVTSLATEISSVTEECTPDEGAYTGGAGFNGCISADPILMRQVLPPEPTTERSGGKDWADDFIILMEFWTDSLSANACILPAESKAADWKEDVRRYFYDNGNNHGSHRRECGWDLTYSFGFAS